MKITYILYVRVVYGFCKKKNKQTKKETEKKYTTLLLNRYTVCNL